MALYNWATNPGTRIAPSAGQKASGFVPATPASAENMNDVLGEITDALVVLNPAFAAQHNPTTGVHTNITGVTAVFTGAVDASTYDISAGELHTEHKAVSQPFPLGTGEVEEWAYGGVYFPVIKLDPLENSLFDLGPYQAGVDVDVIYLYFLAYSGLAYDITWELLRFNPATATYTSLGSSTFAATPGADLVIATLNIPDSSPVFPGRGAHITVPCRLYLKLTHNNTNVNPQRFYNAWVAHWAYNANQY